MYAGSILRGSSASLRSALPGWRSHRRSALSEQSLGHCDLYDRHLFPQGRRHVCGAHHLRDSRWSHGAAGAAPSAAGRPSIRFDPARVRGAGGGVPGLRHDLDSHPHSIAAHRAWRRNPGSPPKPAGNRAVLVHAHRPATHPGIDQRRGDRLPGTPSFRAFAPLRAASSPVANPFCGSSRNSSGTTR